MNPRLYIHPSSDVAAAWSESQRGLCHVFTTFFFFFFETSALSRWCCWDCRRSPLSSERKLSSLFQRFDKGRGVWPQCVSMVLVGGKSEELKRLRFFWNNSLFLRFSYVRISLAPRSQFYVTYAERRILLKWIKLRYTVFCTNTFFLDLVNEYFPIFSSFLLLSSLFFKSHGGTSVRREKQGIRDTAKTRIHQYFKHALHQIYFYFLEITTPWHKPPAQN